MLDVDLDLSPQREDAMLELIRQKKHALFVSELLIKAGGDEAMTFPIRFGMLLEMQQMVEPDLAQVALCAERRSGLLVLIKSFAESHGDLLCDSVQAESIGKMGFCQRGG